MSFGVFFTMTWRLVYDEMTWRLLHGEAMKAMETNSVWTVSGMVSVPW